MRIPFDPRGAAQQGEAPDEAMMLMALAHMKEIGRIPQPEQKLAANVIPIRGPKSLQRAIGEAEGDEDLAKIRSSLEKRGMHIPSQLGPGVLTPTDEK